MSNSYKHAFKGRNKGEICVHLSQSESEEEICLKISDNGVGLPEFSDLDLNKSLGITLIKTLANQLDAEFDFRNEEGAVFEFRFEKKDKAGELDTALLEA
ncbi:ATP-binding protein [Gracilimonas sp.]|uniref:ATP-binding protein n=1 Tax=Gracilimonas sp. TaxID=1974203 RepID=UPI002871FDAE|nr:sensor histidine kinase [Gracilimonas sp.]